VLVRPVEKTFGIEVVRPKCQAPLCLIPLIQIEDVAKEILTAMHLPFDVPRPLPRQAGGGGDW
jgi:hypothetical protein